MSTASRRVAGLLLLLIDRDSGYQDNALRQDLWRAGHAHDGVMRNT